MKKLSLLLLGSLAVTQVAQANSGRFNGFYLGAQLGWVGRHDKTDLPAVTQPEPLDGVKQDGLSQSKKTSSLGYGLYAGYGQNNRGFYWGGEFSIEHDTANKETSYTIPSKIEGVPNGVAPYLDSVPKTTLNTKYQRGVVFGFAPRIGVVIANDNLIYVKLGMEYSRDEVSARYNWEYTPDPARIFQRSNTEASKNQFVFVPGFGYERAFGNLLARVEYGYNFGAKIKTSNLVRDLNTLADNRLNNTAPTVQYSAHVVKFGLAYRF